MNLLEAYFPWVLALTAGVGVAWLWIALLSMKDKASGSEDLSSRVAVQGSATSVTQVRFRDRLLRFTSWSQRMHLERKLQHAGLFRWQVSDLLLLRLAVSTGCATCTLLVTGSFLFAGCAAFVGLALIGQWIQQKRHTYSSHIGNHLPGFLDLLCLCLFAGMSFNNALLVVLRYMNDGPLRVLWRDWLFDVRAGSTRTQALTRLLHKSEQMSLQRLCVAMIQAEKTGAALAPGLQSQAKQLRTEQLLSAERRAAQAPMKMLLPLILCFFPSTFLVLAFSIWVGVNEIL